MYIFRIIDMIDSSKAWYKGEKLSDAAYHYTVVTNPPMYPVNFSGGHAAGSAVDRYGYIYTSLKDNNSTQPEHNYVGYPITTEDGLYGQNSWIRTDYANETKMMVASSGGITESYNGDITGFLIPPYGSIPNGFFNAVESMTCVLFCGLLCESATINGRFIQNLDFDGLNQGVIGNPEESGFNSAITMSTLSTHQFDFSLYKASSAVSTWCAGAYLGSWGYIGKTQWSNHKKQLNDYSKQEQDQWGNYSLAKRRSGRTYSAEVILQTRVNADPLDYDYSIKTLCFSVHQFCMSLLGKCSAFYFNNQDIGLPWCPYNTAKADEIIRLTDSDIIVGVLQNFEIADIQGNRAVLKLSVNSVPNEYKNYSDLSYVVPSSAPAVDPESFSPFESVTYTNLITSETMADYDRVDVIKGTNRDSIDIVPTPEDSVIQFYAITKMLEYIDDPAKPSIDDICDYTVTPYSEDHKKITIHLEGKDQTTYNNTTDWGMRVVTKYWSPTSNSYEFTALAFWIRLHDS